MRFIRESLSEIKDFNKIFTDGDVDTGFLFKTYKEYTKALEWLRENVIRETADFDAGALEEDDYYFKNYKYYIEFTDTGRNKLEQILYS